MDNKHATYMNNLQTKTWICMINRRHKMCKENHVKLVYAAFPASVITQGLKSENWEKDNGNIDTSQKPEGSLDGLQMVNFPSARLSSSNSTWQSRKDSHFISVFIHWSDDFNSNCGPTEILSFYCKQCWESLLTANVLALNLPFICCICRQLEINPLRKFHNLFIPHKLWILSRLVVEMFPFPWNNSVNSSQNRKHTHIWKTRCITGFVSNNKCEVYVSEETLMNMLN